MYDTDKSQLNDFRFKFTFKAKSFSKDFGEANNDSSDKSQDWYDKGIGFRTKNLVSDFRVQYFFLDD